MYSAGLGWAGLGWAGLGWAGLGWAGLGWAGLGWAGLGWVGLSWAGLGIVAGVLVATSLDNNVKTEIHRHQFSNFFTFITILYAFHCHVLQARHTLKFVYIHHGWLSLLYMLPICEVGGLSRDFFIHGHSTRDQS